MPAPELDHKLLQGLDAAFAHLAGDDAVIDIEEFRRATGIRAEYLARRLFGLLDADSDGVIRRDEFLHAVRALVLGSPRERLHFAFRLHDHDADGALDQVDLDRMVTLALAEDDVATTDARVQRLVRGLLSSADVNGDGRISFEEFETALGRHPRLLEQMTRDEARWIAPNEDVLARLEEARGNVATRASRLESGWAPLVFVAVWAALNVALLMAGFRHGARAGHSVDFVAQVGRAATGPIELDAGLVLFPVLRRLLTRLRRTWIGRVVPVDDAVGFHRIVGHTLFGLCMVHGTATLLGYARATRPFLAQLATERASTGALLLGVFALMWVCAWQVVRRTSKFELFYFTHLLYFAWIALAIAHAPSLLGWMAPALVGLAIELGWRAAQRGKVTAVESLHALRSGVTRLQIRKPAGFVHRAGDYLFLRLPEIARHEWHPFSITSAPESAALTVHVRALGNWTKALRKRAESAPSVGALPVYVDGPYGSPSGHVFESRVAVLVGAGIGVTPFASILESIVLRANRRSERAPSLERAHFFWLNRDQYSFEWFAALLAELERIDGAGVLDVNIWMTGGRAGAASAALELARELSRAAGDPDVVTGLRTKTHMGRPDWDETLRQIAREHAPETVDVYFCGPPALGRIVRRASVRANMRFREERF